MPHQTNTIPSRLRLFFTLIDSRFEDLDKKTWKKTLYRDFSAGLIVALTAIPMAMGFAIAMGLRPEQGIIAGALACIVGRTFGGSKYQVYGPTAAFIPVVAGLIYKYGPESGGNFAEAHGFLVFVSIIAGLILMAMGVFGLGRFAKLVPNSIVVGFTVGIGVSIAVTNLGEILGLTTDLRGNLFSKISTAIAHISEFNPAALTLALLTLGLTIGLLKISVFIPAPLIAMFIATLLGATLFSQSDVRVVSDEFGRIPTDFFAFTPPRLPVMTSGVVIDILYFVSAIVFVSGIESLLCSSMADRLANNKKTPFNPDKEFWGQGLVQIITPLFNGFPCTGALARTATSIKAGAVTPMAGYFKGVLKLVLAFFLAAQLERVPLACIGGILLWVATNMINVKEIKEISRHGRFELGMMTYTAVMVPMTDFLTGVLSALILYAVLSRWFKPKQKGPSTSVSSEIPNTSSEPAAQSQNEVATS